MIFGVVLLYSAYLSAQKKGESRDHSHPPDRIATWLKLDSSYPSLDGIRTYRVSNVPAGFGLWESREFSPVCWESVRAP